MNKLIYICFILFLGPVALAKDLSQEFSDLKKLHKKREEKIRNKILSQLDQLVLQNKEVDWEAISISEPFYIFIPKGTNVFSVDANKRFKISKDIYTIGLRKADYEDFIYLVSKDDKVYYKVQASKILSLDYDLQMFAQPSRYHEYHPLEKQYREPIDLEIAVSIHQDTYNAVYSSDIFDIPSLSQGSGGRFATDLYFSFDKFFDLGVFAEFESGKLQSAGATAEGTKSAFLLGGILRTRPLRFYFLSPRILAKFGYAIDSKIEFQGPTSSQEEKFNQTTVELALEQTWKTDYGKLGGGVSFRRQWLKNIGNDRNIRFSSRAAYDDSVGLYLTWGWGWRE